MPPLDFEEIPDAGDQMTADTFSSSFGGDEQQTWNPPQSMEPAFGETSFGMEGLQQEVPAQQEQQSSWMPEPEQDDALT